MTIDDDGPVEHYLDDLLRRLPGDAHAVRRALAEAEAHLYDAVEAHRAAGLAQEDAERAAVAEFGPAPVVAGGFGSLRPSDLVRPVVLLGAIGLLAVGLSGALSELMGRVWGARFVAGDLPGASYTSARCADFQEYFPGHGCLDAAALHHFGEVVLYRGAAGALGLLALVAWRLLPRRRALPTGAPHLVGMVAFGGAAGLTASAAVNAAAQGGAGAGQWLSAAVVAVGLTAAYVVALMRTFLPTR